LNIQEDVSIPHEETEPPFEYDESQESDIEPPMPEATKKKSPLVMIAAAAVAVIILFSVMWVKFSGSEMTASDPSGIYVPMPDISLQPSEIRPPDMPSVNADAIPVMQIHEMAAAPVIPAVPVPLESSPVMVVEEAAIIEISQNQNESPMAVVVEESDVVETAPQVSVVSSEETEALKSKIASLEDTIKELEAKIAQMTEEAQKKAAAPAPKAAAPKPQASSAAAPKPVASQRLEVPAKAQVQAQEAPVLRAPELAARKKPSVRSSSAYVIRAARPGQAWIAKSESATDLREVHIGDTVPGLGKIQSIFLDANGWAIVGSEAILR